jgi:hypothetical protein
MTVTMTKTARACWKCSAPLFRLEPKIDGWRFHCQACQHFTSPQTELQAALECRPHGSVGIVSAVPCHIDMVQG